MRNVLVYGFNIKKEALKGRGYKMTEERRQRLEVYLADFKDNDQIWLQTMTQCEQFKQSTNKYPSTIAEDKNEKHLGQWLSDQKRALKGEGNGRKMTEERRQRLETYLADFKDNDQIWDETMTQCEQFKQSTNKYPSKEAKDKDEKRLGKWLQHQKEALKGNGNGIKMTEERRERLETYLADFKDNDQIWDEQMTQCELFKQSTNKYPSTTAKDKDEKRLGQWLYNQKQALKGNGNGRKMTEERRQRLETYLADFYNQKTKTMQINTCQKQMSDEEETKTSGLDFEYKSLMSQLHQKYKTMNSQTLSSLFAQNAQLWFEYHQLNEQNEQGFVEQQKLPYNRIVRYLREMKFKRTKLALDLGCGLNRIKKELEEDQRFQFRSFDHVCIDQSVEKCDIRKLPVEDDSVNICILCLSLWGSNNREYIEECYRVLEKHGILLIVEPVKRWLQQDGSNRLVNICQDCGFDVNILEQDKFQFIELMKK